jgi:AraC family transcriptional regulator, carnitine catabolism transcriptional activator
MTTEDNGGLPKSIGFLLLPGFSMLALVNMFDPLCTANRLLGYRHYVLRIYTPDGSPAQSAGGMVVSADARAASASHQEDPSCLIVIAGFDPWPPPNLRLRNWLRRLDRGGATLGAIDTGAFLLASANLLGNVRTVVHWESAGALLELFPELTLSENLYEIEGRRILCAGGVAVLDMIITLLERAHGAALAAGVADRMMHDVCGGWRNNRVFPVSADPLPVSDPEVLKAIEIMETRVETVVSIDEIACVTKVSKRTLERKFRRSLNQTPTQAYLQCRLKHAQQLLQNTDLNIREIALASGFASMSYFCRAYKRQFQKRPGSDRRLDYSLVEPGTVLGSGTWPADAKATSRIHEQR